MYKGKYWGWCLKYWSRKIMERYFSWEFLRDFSSCSIVRDLRDFSFRGVARWVVRISQNHCRDLARLNSKIYWSTDEHSRTNFSDSVLVFFICEVCFFGKGWVFLSNEHTDTRYQFPKLDKTNMHKAAHLSGGMCSSNPRRWRGERLQHHGDGVCLVICAWLV